MRFRKLGEVSLDNFGGGNGAGSIRIDMYEDLLDRRSRHFVDAKPHEDMDALGVVSEDLNGTFQHFARTAFAEMQDMRLLQLKA